MKKTLFIAAVIGAAAFICYQYLPNKEERDNKAFITLLKNRGAWIFPAEGLGENCFISPTNHFDDEISPLLEQYGMDYFTSYDISGACITRLYGSMAETETIK